MALLLLLLISACQVQELQQQTYPETIVLTESVSVTQVAPTVTIPTASVTPQVTNTEIPVQVEISSPLAGVEFGQLSTLIYNPFYLPPDGSDDPHQGVDFSIIDPQSQIAVSGAGVSAIIDGEVAAIMDDRFPYGNAILISTPIESLPLSWKEMIDYMPVPSVWEKTSALSCPQGWDAKPENAPTDLLYILYAHLQNPLQVKVGEQIKAGSPIGLVGMSGNALAPHLHVEIRYGAEADFSAGMAHYTVSASVDEMSNYCRWRISGWFRPIDPMLFLLSENP